MRDASSIDGWKGRELGCWIRPYHEAQFLWNEPRVGEKDRHLQLQEALQ